MQAFHTYQMLEAGVRQFTAWGNTDADQHILIGVARYLAALSPTERAALQTADIARRLMRARTASGGWLVESSRPDYVFGDLSPAGRGFLAISSRRPASWLSCHLRASAAALCQVGLCAAIFGNGAFLSMVAIER
jgi:hypothetical protein